MPRLRARVLCLALFLSAIAAAPFFVRGSPQGSRYFLELSLVTDFPGTLQAFYDVGRGFNEADSQQQRLVVSPDPQRYRFPLHSGVYKGLRIDPTNTDHTVTCALARIVDRQDRVVQVFAPGQFQPTHQITLVEKPAGLEMRPTPGTNDPFSELQLPAPLDLPYFPALGDRIVAAGPIFALVFVAVWLVALATAGELRWLPLHQLASARPSADSRGRAWLFAGGIVAAVLLKSWLTAVQTIRAIGPATYDDQLFISQAETIARGEWLGGYSQFALMKGPFYSILIAALYKAGVPLFTALRLGYAAACVLVVVALRPLVLHRGVRFAIFLLLLFNPVTFESEVNARVLRQNLLPVLTLLIVAGLVGAHARLADRAARWFHWMLLTGLTLPAFWLTREEGVWLLPAIALCWIPTVVAVLRQWDLPRRSRLLLLALPPVLWVAGLGAVAAVNLRYYGIFTTCEFGQREFRDAFGALLRVQPEQPLPFIAVPRATRQQLYELSPAFAELKPYLDGPRGWIWAVASESLTHIPPERLEIANGWFVWALRDAVARSGHCDAGPQAMAFYARLAREINAVCDSGMLKAGPRRSGFMPRVGLEIAGPFLKESAHAVGFFCSFAEMHTVPQFSTGTPEQLADFARLTHGKLSPLPTDPAPAPPPAYKLRLGALDLVSRCYQLAMPWFSGASFLVWIATCCVMLTRRRLGAYSFWVSTGLLGSVAALLTAIVLIQVTSFPAVNTGYLSGCYGIWLLFCAMAWLALGDALRRPAAAPPWNAETKLGGAL